MKKTSELFNQWNEKKKDIEFTTNDRNDIKVWEFWWYYVGMNIGNEISKDGRFLRVGLVIKNNMWNWLILIAPLTTQNHSYMKKYYIEVQWTYLYGLKKSNIIINQIHPIDRKRFLCCSGTYKPLGNFAKKVLYTYITFLNTKNATNNMCNAFSKGATAMLSLRSKLG